MSEGLDEPLSQWEDVEASDDNMLIRMDWDRLQQEFYAYLEKNTKTIQNIVNQHMSLPTHKQCVVADRSGWIAGTFNVCIPILVRKPQPKRLMLRCPFPHRMRRQDGTALEEKIRCEAAAYAWISKHCSQVPIPRIWGFGLPSGLAVDVAAGFLAVSLTWLQYTHVLRSPWYRRLLQYTERVRNRIFRKSSFTPFVPRSNSPALDSGYILIDLIENEQGTMLSSVWPPPSDVERQTFYKSMSKIILDLAQPLDRIGSFTVNDSGDVTLSNRALTKQMAVLESEGIPGAIPRSTCHTSTYDYVHDLLDYHDVRLQNQPNSVRHKLDLDGHMAVLTMQRAVLPLYTQRHLRQGPFVPTLTDRHASNIFVDDQYRVTFMIDLEFTSVQPIEMQHPPFWLSGHEFDDFLADESQDKEQRRSLVQKFEQACQDFLKAFEEEDQHRHHLQSGLYSRVMRVALEKQSHWYFAALKEPRAAYEIFVEHLQPHLAPAHTQGVLHADWQDIASQYWTVNTSEFVERKMAERERYLIQLREKFARKH